MQMGKSKPQLHLTRCRTAGFTRYWWCAELGLRLEEHEVYDWVKTRSEEVIMTDPERMVKA